MKAQTEELEKVRGQLSDLQKAVGDVVPSTIEKLLAASGIEQFAQGALELGTQIATQIIQGIATTLKGGIDFNSLLEVSQIGIAANLKAANPDIHSFTESLQIASDVVDQLRQREQTLPVSLGQLIQNFQGTASAATRAGVSINEQIDILDKATRATAALGLEQSRLPTFLSEIYAGISASRILWRDRLASRKT